MKLDVQLTNITCGHCNGTKQIEWKSRSGRIHLSECPFCCPPKNPSIGALAFAIVMVFLGLFFLWMLYRWVNTLPFSDSSNFGMACLLVGCIAGNVTPLRTKAPQQCDGYRDLKCTNGLLPKIVPASQSLRAQR